MGGGAGCRRQGERQRPGKTQRACLQAGGSGSGCLYLTAAPPGSPQLCPLHPPSPSLPPSLPPPSLPCLQSRCDALINAPTGSGKTLRCGARGWGWLLAELHSAAAADAGPCDGGGCLQCLCNGATTPSSCPSQHISLAARPVPSWLLCCAQLPGPHRSRLGGAAAEADAGAGHARRRDLPHTRALPAGGVGVAKGGERRVHRWCRDLHTLRGDPAASWCGGAGGR